ncbi:hypothetical protein D3C73_1290950 [compost metagenome]
MRSTSTPASRFPGRCVSEYMPIIHPMKAGPAPREIAKGVRMGYWACRSKKARKRNKYSHSAVFTGKHLHRASLCTAGAQAGAFSKIRQARIC